MKFLTRKLYDGIQGDPERPEMADMNAKWERAWTAYREQLDRIRMKLPERMQRFADLTLHDGTVESVDRSSAGVVTLTIDASDNPWGPRGRYRVRFTGVQEVEGIADLVGEDWLYEEVHLHPTARFDFHVMFSHSDFRVVADDVEFDEVAASGPAN